MSIVNLIPKIISEANQNKGKKTEEVNENRHEHIF